MIDGSRSGVKFSTETAAKDGAWGFLQPPCSTNAVSVHEMTAGCGQIRCVNVQMRPRAC